MERPALPPLHLLLAIAVIAVWGTNFVVIKAALGHLPPLTFAALRFTFAFLPAAFFLKRPAVPLAQPGALRRADRRRAVRPALHRHQEPDLARPRLAGGADAGFFTIGLAMWLSGERVRPLPVAALALAGAGLAWLIAHAGAEATPLGLVLVLLAGLSWAGGNMRARANGPVNMLAYVVWASLFSAPPLFALALAMEGWPHGDEQHRPRRRRDLGGGRLAVAGQYAVRLRRLGLAARAPPGGHHLAALAAGAGVRHGRLGLLLGEPLPGWKLTAAALVLSGLALNVFWPRISALVRVPAPAE